MDFDPSDTNTQVLRRRDARNPTELEKISADRAALVQELLSRDRIGHRALDRSDLAGEKTARLPWPPEADQPRDLPLPHRAPQAALAGADAVTLTPRWNQLGRLLTALRKRWSW